MTDKSENSELLVESQEANPKNQEKEETIPINQKATPMVAEQKAKEEVVQEKPAPKSRGRPAGSKDNKPRGKRVPVQQQQQCSSSRRLQQKKRSQKRSDSNTRKQSHSQKSQTSQKSSRLPNLHAHCTRSVSDRQPCRDDRWRKLGKIALSAYLTISWASSKKDNGSEPAAGTNAAKRATDYSRCDSEWHVSQ